MLLQITGRKSSKMFLEPTPPAEDVIALNQ